MFFVQSVTVVSSVWTLMSGCATTGAPAWKGAAPNLPMYTKNGSEYTRYWILPSNNNSLGRGDAQRRNSSRGLLHVVALATPESCRMLSCWQSWSRSMQLQDDRIDYITHVYKFASLQASRAAYGSRSYNRATAAKAEVLDNFLRWLPQGAVLLFTDLDVLPLRSYSELLQYMEEEAPSIEIFFQWEYLTHMPVNTGFILLKNTLSVRQLIRDWRERLAGNDAIFGPGTDQRILNHILLFQRTCNHRHPYCRYCNLSVRWGNFPVTLVSAMDKHLSASLVAFHATGASTETAKMSRISNALRAMHNLTNGSHWQHTCNEHHSHCHQM